MSETVYHGNKLTLWTKVYLQTMFNTPLLLVRPVSKTANDKHDSFVSRRADVEDLIQSKKFS